MITTFRDEIIRILKRAKKPMTSKEITKELLRRGNIKPRGATPQATVTARIIEEIKEKGSNAAFKRVENGYAFNKI